MCCTLNIYNLTDVKCCCSIFESISSICRFIYQILFNSYIFLFQKKSYIYLNYNFLLLLCYDIFRTHFVDCSDYSFDAHFVIRCTINMFSATLQKRTLRQRMLCSIALVTHQKRASIWIFVPTCSRNNM